MLFSTASSGRQNRNCLPVQQKFRIATVSENHLVNGRCVWGILDPLLTFFQILGVRIVTAFCDHHLESPVQDVWFSSACDRRLDSSNAFSGQRMTWAHRKALELSTAIDMNRAVQPKCRKITFGWSPVHSEFSALILRTTLSRPSQERLKPETGEQGSERKFGCIPASVADHKSKVRYEPFGDNIQLP